jgi:hypothetical protein
MHAVLQRLSWRCGCPVTLHRMMPPEKPSGTHERCPSEHIGPDAMQRAASELDVISSRQPVAVMLREERQRCGLSKRHVGGIRPQWCTCAQAGDHPWEPGIDGTCLHGPVEQDSMSTDGMPQVVWPSRGGSTRDPESLTVLTPSLWLVAIYRRERCTHMRCYTCRDCVGDCSRGCIAGLQGEFHARRDGEATTTAATHTLSALQRPGFRIGCGPRLKC